MVANGFPARIESIIAYSIRAARQSGLFGEVMVSTEDEEVAAIRQQYGTRVPFYRSAATDDFAPMATVLTEVLAKYSARGETFEYGCCNLSDRAAAEHY